MSVKEETGQMYVSNADYPPIILEWEKINPKTPRLNDKIMSLIPLLIPAYAKIECDFAKKNPQAIATDIFLKPLEPLIKNGIEHIDWSLANDQIETILANFFANVNWSLYAREKDVHYFIVAKCPASEKLLGMIQCIISPLIDAEAVKIELYAMNHVSEKNIEVEKMLLSSIFKLMPNTKKIVFHTRNTNFTDIKTHEMCGFSKKSHKNQELSKVFGDLLNWTNLEYRIEECDFLQKFSTMIRGWDG